MPRDYPNNPKYWDKQALAKSVDPDQMPQNVASDQGLHCLPLIQHYCLSINVYSLCRVSLKLTYLRQVASPTTTLWTNLISNRSGLVSDYHTIPLCFIETYVFNANSADLDQMLYSAVWMRHLIWVCTVCQLPFCGFLNWNGLIIPTG